MKAASLIFFSAGGLQGFKGTGLGVSKMLDGARPFITLKTSNSILKWILKEPGSRMNELQFLN